MLLKASERSVKSFDFGRPFRLEILATEYLDSVSTVPVVEERKVLEYKDSTYARYEDANFVIEMLGDSTWRTINGTGERMLVSVGRRAGMGNYTGQMDYKELQRQVDSVWTDVDKEHGWEGLWVRFGPYGPLEKMVSWSDARTGMLRKVVGYQRQPKWYVEKEGDEGRWVKTRVEYVYLVKGMKE